MKKITMPSERPSVTRRFVLGDLKAYATVGLLESGQPGEIFIVLKKTGTLTRGLCHVLAIMISLCLQHGVPLEKVVDKLKGVRFEPSGFTHDSDFPTACSIVDYIGQWLEKRFLSHAK